MTDITKKLDMRGATSPVPILEIMHTMSRMRSGEILKVTVTEPGTEQELREFCEQKNHELLNSRKTGKEFCFLVRKG